MESATLMFKNSHHPTAGLQTLQSKFVLDASGPARVLPKLLNLQKPSPLPAMSSLFAHLVDQDRNSPQGNEIDFEKIWICVHPEHTDIWYWTIAFSNGNASVGVVGPQEKLKTPENTLEACFLDWLEQEPHLKKRFTKPQFVRPVQSASQYSVCCQKLYGEGFAILGHSGEFSDPIFSSGIAISLKSAQLATQTLIRQWAGEDVDWQADYEKPLYVGLQDV